MLRPFLIATALSVVVLFSGAAAASAATCSASSLPRYPGSGYFTSLKVTKVSCSTGKKVMLAHYKCRTKHGKTGRCSKVLGYSCKESRRSIETEIDGTVLELCQDLRVLRGVAHHSTFPDPPLADLELRLHERDDPAGRVEQAHDDR